MVLVDYSTAESCVALQISVVCAVALSQFNIHSVHGPHFHHGPYCSGWPVLPPEAHTAPEDMSGSVVLL